MILTSHRLDCFKLCIDLRAHSRSFEKFDHVVLLLNGVEGRHLEHVQAIMKTLPQVPWDTIAGPRGRGERISNLQNACVKKYPNALYFKIDEDTFVANDWVDRLTAAYEAHKNDTALSLITPVIPNNAAGFFHLLNTFPKLADEYRTFFSHPIDATCDGTVWKYPQVASWITRKFLDMSAANAELRTRNTELEARNSKHFSYRFSINCIVYDYRHWLEIGGVPTEDELGWGQWIPKNNKFIVLVTDILVHHYSFFVQQDWLDRTSLLEDIRNANLPQKLRGLAYHVPRWTRIAQQIPKVISRRFVQYKKRS